MISIRLRSRLNVQRGFSSTLRTFKPLIFTDSILSKETLINKGITPNLDSTVKITQIAYTALPEMILEPFKRFGNIQYIHVPYDEKSGSLKGLSFIKFEDPRTAKRASSQMNGFVINDFPIRTQVASDKSHLEITPYEILMLKNLSYDTKDEDVMNVFGPYQAIRVGLRRAPVGDKPCLGYGFVRFGTISASTKALEALDQLSINGRQIKLKYAKPMEHNYSYIV